MVLDVTSRLYSSRLIESALLLVSSFALQLKRGQVELNLRLNRSEKNQEKFHFRTQSKWEGICTACRLYTIGLVVEHTLYYIGVRVRTFLIFPYML